MKSKKSAKSVKKRSCKYGGAAKKSAAKRPVAKKSATKRPVAKKSATKRPISKKSATKHTTERKQNIISPSGSVKEENRFLLRSMGYTVKDEDSVRHKILKKVVAKYGKALTIEHLKNVRNLSQFDVNKEKLSRDIKFAESL